MKNKIKNTLFKISFILVLILSFNMNIFAAKKMNVTIDGKAIILESEPIIKNNSTLVPMRKIFEALNTSVDWIASSQSIAATNGDTNIVLQIGSKTAYKNGVETQLILAPQIINGNTYIPLRFVAESLGCSIDLKDDTIIINTPKKTTDKLVVHYIDVGQAESILIQTPDGSNMLIDAGETKQGTVLSYLKNKGITKLDAVVVTHPHKDHISGMVNIINNIEIGSFYMPKIDGENQIFEDMVDALKSKEIKVIEAKKGVNINIDSAIKCNIVAPCSNNYEQLNNWSTVIHLTYNQTSFLFTGDAEELSEREMLASGVTLKADVLKIGHHGDSNATSTNFLNAVNPKYAIISYGKDNDYNHPHKRTLERLKDINTYTTAQNGNIVITSNGEDIKINCSK